MCMKLQLLCIQLYVGRQIAVACSRPLVAHVYSFSQCMLLIFVRQDRQGSRHIKGVPLQCCHCYCHILLCETMFLPCLVALYSIAKTAQSIYYPQINMTMVAVQSFYLN